MCKNTYIHRLKEITMKKNAKDEREMGSKAFLIALTLLNIATVQCIRALQQNLPTIMIFPCNRRHTKSKLPNVFTMKTHTHTHSTDVRLVFMRLIVRTQSIKYQSIGEILKAFSKYISTLKVTFKTF